MTITAIKLVREHRLAGNQQDTVVYAEIGGKFIELIRESLHGNFSHIIERSGINQIAANELSTDDLIASGGIVES